jgi:hypothetical protein
MRRSWSERPGARRGVTDGRITAARFKKLLRYRVRVDAGESGRVGRAFLGAAAIREEARPRQRGTARVRR